MRNSLCTVALLVTVVTFQPAMADVIRPFDYFDVYALGDIGTSGNRFHATFQGVTGTAGSAYLRSSNIAPALPGGAALHVAGDFSAQYSTTLGGSLDVGGHAAMNGVTVAGQVDAGGDIFDFGWGGAVIQGPARAAGDVNFSPRVSVPASHSHVAYASAIDHQAVSDYFRSTSRYVGDLTATGSVTDQWGNLVFTGSDGINVVEVNQQTLRNAWGFTIIAPEDALVFINVPDACVNLDNTSWVLQGGIEQASVLLNLPNALDFTLSQTNMVNILAPWASTEFLQGRIDGLLVVGDLYGGGHVAGGAFNSSAVPEPATLALLALGGMALIRRRRMA